MVYVEDGNYFLMPISEYESIFSKEDIPIEYRKKRIFLDCNTEDYMNYLIATHDKKRHSPDSLITKIDNYYYNFIPCIVSIDSDDLQTGKSVSALQIALMYNRDVNVLNYTRWDFSDVADMYRTYYHKILIEDEIQNSASRFISNTEIEIIQALLTTFGDRNHILITTSGNYDILNMIKRFVRIRIHFIERGLADVWYPVSNINSPKIRYKKIDKYRFLPIPIDLHKAYYSAKHNAVDPEIAKRIEKLRQLKEIKLNKNADIDSLENKRINDILNKLGI